MQEKNGILVFSNDKEEKMYCNEGLFQGILIAKRPYAMLSCDVIEVFPKERKFIGNIDSSYLYGGNKNKDLEKEIVKVLSTKNPAFLKMEIPKIAISNKLKCIFGV